MRYLIVLIALLESAAACGAGKYDDQINSWLSERAPHCGNYTHVLSQFAFGPQYYIQLDGFRLQRIEYSTLSRAETANGIQAKGSLYVTALMGRNYDFDTRRWEDWWNWSSPTEYRFEVKNGQLRVTGSNVRAETIAYMLNPTTCDYAERHFANIEAEERAAADELFAKEEATRREHEAFVAKYGSVSADVLSKECDGSYYFFASNNVILIPDHGDKVSFAISRADATLFRIEKETGQSYAYVDSLFRSRWGRVGGRIGDILERTFASDFEWTNDFSCGHIATFLEKTWPESIVMAH